MVWRVIERLGEVHRGLERMGAVGRISWGDVWYGGESYREVGRG